MIINASLPIDYPATATDVARQLVYRFLSLATSDPRSQRWQQLRQEKLVQTAASAAEFLRGEPECQPANLAPGEISPEALDFAPLTDALRASADDINPQYESIFGLMTSKKCPPYETEYCPQTFSVYRSQALADIAGYYRAFGLEPSRDMPERADHISLELDFMAFLIAKELRATDAEQRAVCRDAQRSFMRDHLAWWVPAFASALQRQSRRLVDPGETGSSFYTVLAENLAAFVPIERSVLGIAPPRELVSPASIELQEEMSCGACAGACEPEESRS